VRGHTSAGYAILQADRRRASAADTRWYEP
jgi:hypothetical protein